MQTLGYLLIAAILIGTFVLVYWATKKTLNDKSDARKRSKKGQRRKFSRY